jgi:hypothetical protein
MKFPQYANKKYKCKKCGHSPLEVFALVYASNKAEPCLVCAHRSCGTLYSLSEYDLTEEMIRDGQ